MKCNIHDYLGLYFILNDDAHSRVRRSRNQAHLLYFSENTLTQIKK